VRAGVERHDVLGASREMQRERAVIAEAVEGTPAGEFTDHHAILALVEEGACLLSCPWGSGVADAVFVHFDFLWNVSGQQLDARGEPFLFSHGNVVAGEDSGR